MNEPRKTPIPRPPGTTRYTWFVGVALFLAVAYFTINTATTKHNSSVGVPVNSPLPPFAVPLALGPLNGDANIATTDRPTPAGTRPSCSVRGRNILNVCQLAERGPVVLAFLATRGAQCLDEVDRLDALSRAFPGVQIAAIAIRGSRDDLRRDIAARGWHLPVGYDRDGALANLYGVAVCPQLTLASVGGIVRQNIIGEASSRRLRQALRALVADSVRLHWHPPQPA
jgi:AhpC/TSA family